MSDLTARRRKRRVDAERSIALILDTAVRVLNERPQASVGEIASAAGLTRPTVYAHFPSREALLTAVVDHITAEHVAAVDAADIDQGPPFEALRRVLAAGWRTVERYPLLLRTSSTGLSPQAEHDRHQPIQERLEQLVKRGQEAGDFDRQQLPSWLATVIIGLGHTAAEQVAGGRMSAEEARNAYERSVVRVFERNDAQ